MRFYIIVRAIFAPIIKLLYRVRISGAENEPDTPFIVCANHSSAVDAIMLACIIKQPLHFIAKQSLVKNRFVKWLFDKLGMIYVNRDGHDIAAVKSMLTLARRGESIGIFPQGTRMPGVIPLPDQALPGFAAIAMTTKVAVLPVSIVTNRLRPKMFSKTQVIIHPAVTYDEYSGFKEKPTRDEVCAYCFEKVCRPFGERS